MITQHLYPFSLPLHWSRHLVLRVMTRLDSQVTFASYLPTLKNKNSCFDIQNMYFAQKFKFFRTEISECIWILILFSITVHVFFIPDNDTVQHKFKFINNFHNIITSRWYWTSTTCTVSLSLSQKKRPDSLCYDGYLNRWCNIWTDCGSHTLAKDG